MKKKKKVKIPSLKPKSYVKLNPPIEYRSLRDSVKITVESIYPIFFLFYFFSFFNPQDYINLILIDV